MAAAPMTVTLRMPAKTYRRLGEMALARGYSAAGYAHLLFDAAFAARVGQERDDPVTDADLDEQVRLVFACAGQANTAAIARATGLPEARVERILAAWKTAAKSERAP